MSDISAVIAPYLAAGATLRNGRKHNVLTLSNGRRIGIPKTPSCWRACRNLQAQLKRLAKQPDNRPTRAVFH